MLIYYVYAYLRSDGTPYYVGKGKDRRAFKKGKSEVLSPKDKSRIVFLETNLSEVGAYALERRMIRWYGRKDKGTGILRNMTDGGDGCSGLIFSEEYRRKISDALKGRKFSEKHRRKLRGNKNWLGKTHSEETRRKISESGKGRIKGKGKGKTEEHRRKISEANKGRIFSEEHRRKISEANKGTIFSEEHRRKMSEAAKKREAQKRLTILMNSV